MKKILLILLALPLLAACGAAQTGPKADAPGEADLVGKNFVLTSVNGEPYTGERVPTLRFNENMRVSGQVCNLFNGPGQLKNGVLTVPQMASTMMMCVGSLNKLERDFSTLLRDGAALSLEDGNLILKGKDISLEYRAASPEK